MTLRHYRLFHQAWTEHPPAEWLKAAELGYKSPQAKFNEAVANTQRIGERLGLLPAGKKPPS